MKTKKIGILNGPNLGALGQREPAIYGSKTLADLENEIREAAKPLGFEVECYQSNIEGELIDKIEHWRGKVTGVVFNPGAYTHTSIALRDAIAGSGLKFIEVHISNIYARERFRKHSYTAGVSVGVITGLGFEGYVMGMTYLAQNY